jgi:DNA-binding LacI/PurR family transcriptional regulator
MKMKQPPQTTDRKRRGRIPHRQQAVLHELRRQIVSGGFAPGARLPIRTELQQRFDASCITVQRVLDRLASDGLVTAHGRQGTFVVDRPPHLHRIALVFPFGPGDDGRWQNYYAALLRAAHRLIKEGVELSICIAEDRHRPTAAFEHLQAICRDGLLAGVIFASPPEVWAGMPMVEAQIPRIALTGTQRQDVVQVRPDHDSFAARAAAHLAARGCRRPAVIASTTISWQPQMLERWHRLFADAGVPIRAQWLLGAHLEIPDSASHLARLLCAPWCSERPDALVIADDNFTEAVLAGLMSEGVRVGSEMLVLAHTNFPHEGSAVVPVERLGFDVTALLRHAIAQIAAMRGGKPGTPFLLSATAGDGT